MMEQLKQLTKKQQDASNPKNSCWVFASAGSGKTTILTNRVLRLLLEGTNPGKILCLTFTNAAATEMHSRINKELSIWSRLDESTLKDKLQQLTGENINSQTLKKAKSLLFEIIDNEHKIKVQTIHSFCQGLMKIFPFEANISPTFEIAEDKQEKALLKEAINQTFIKANNNATIYELITHISSKVNEESLLEILFKIINKKDQLKNCNTALIKKNLFSIFDLNDDITTQQIFDKIITTLKNQQLTYIFTQLSQSTSKKNTDLAQNYRDFIINGSVNNIAHLQEIFFTKENKVRKIYASEAKDEELVAQFDFSAQIIAKYIDKINSIIIANDSTILLQLVLIILEEYDALKKRHFKLDYNDLITLTNQLLHNSEFRDWIKMKMDSNFDHILVDESQDTNHQQWNIIKALSEDFFSGESKSDENRSIFIVGDEKQSIYSFQGADATISVDIYRYFKEKLGDKLLNIQLNNSFRSKKEILEVVDNIFNDEIKAKAISKASLYQNHNAIKEGNAKIEIWPQIIKEKEEKKEIDYRWNLNFDNIATQKEPAEIMAKHVASMIRDKVDKGANFGDFMILLRKRTGEFDTFLNKYLTQYNIDFISPSKIKFSNNLLINDLINMAKFCCLKEDDLNLASLLKSPFFKYSDDELLQICDYKNKHNVTLFCALLNLRKDDYDLLNHFYNKAQTCNISEFYYYLIYQRDYYKNFIACFGHKSEAILNAFLHFLNDFEQKYSRNLQILLEYIDNFDYELSAIIDSHHKVLISTVHSAKGLQSKIVIMPDCCYNFSQLLSAKENIFWHQNLPIWCAKKDLENDFILELKNQKITLAQEEYLRLLYVGLTRAEEELYIGGFGNATDPNNWYEIIKTANPQYVLDELPTYTPFDLKESTQSSFINYKNNYQSSTISSPTNHISNNAQESGIAIHKALELIGNNHHIDQTKLQIISENLINNHNNISSQQKEKLINNINKFLNSDLFINLFKNPKNKEILCEVDISSHNQQFRIDLLIFAEDSITIIDYKSDNKISPSNINKYHNQLQNYKYILEKIHPNIAIKTAILWTQSLELDWVDIP